MSLVDYGGKGLAEWMTAHPYRCPAAAVPWKIDTDPGHDGEEPDVTSAWPARGMKPQNWRWVPLQRSRQWAAFKDLLTLLKDRGNRVFVIVGPFNPHMLKPESLGRYRSLQKAIAGWLDRCHPDYYMAPDLPAGEYGDSSHPLAAGYQRAAAALYNDDRFRRWLAGARRDAD